MYNKLTEDQKNIYNFLKQKIRAYGYPPSIEEICVKTNIISPSDVKEILSVLEEFNLINLDYYDKDYIKILEDDFYNLDIFTKTIKDKDGNLYENIPVFTLQTLQETTPSIIKFLKSNKYFLVKDLDDSMSKIGILETSMILLDPNAILEKDGDIILTFIEDEEKVLLKAIFRKGEKYLLKSADTSIPDIITKDIVYLGKLIHVF